MAQVGWFQREGYPWPAWAEQQSLYDKYHHYFSGQIFGEFSASQDAESPLMYPLKINLFRGVVETLSTALWGSFEDEELLFFRVEPKKRGEDVSKTAKANAGIAERLINAVWDGNQKNTILMSASVSQMKYGGVYMRTRWDGKRVVVEAIPADMCFPVWSPQNADELLVLVMAYPISLKAAQEMYGVATIPTSSHEDVLFIEEWTTRTHKIWLDNILINDTPNPYPFIPYDYIPTRRDLESFYGVSPAECLMGIQDEINKRLADVGDYLNYSAHPIRWIRDYRGDPDKDLPVGPDVLWNLGKTVNPQSPPTVGTLEAQPVPPGTFEYMSNLLGLAQDVAHTPPVAYGRDEGSQRSALTLTVRMWPLLQTIKAGRLYWTDGFQRVNDKVVWIASHIGDASPDVDGHKVAPVWASILPRDRMALVEEVIRLSDAGLKAPGTAFKDLGVEDPEEEEKNVKKWIEFQAKNMVIQKGVPQKKASSEV